MDNISRAIQYLVEHDGLRLPYNFIPGSFAGGLDSNFDAKSWGIYQWNPPGSFAAGTFDQADPDASQKPNWQTLVSAAPRAALADARRYHDRKIVDEEARRICVAYIGDQDVPKEIENEILYRLRAPAAELAPKNTERDRLHARSVALVAGLATMTLAQLQAFDPTQDSHWAVQTQGN